VVEPANAELKAARVRAEGDAAPILERGRASAEALKMLYEQVKQGGDNAFAVLLAEKLPQLLGDNAFAVLLAEKLPQLLETSIGAVEGVNIDRVVVLDGGGGEGVSNAVNQKVHGALGTMEAISAAVGVDIQEVLQGAAKKVGSGEGK